MSHPLTPVNASFRKPRPILIAVATLACLAGGCTMTKFTSDPPGAEIRVNDDYIGKTPCRAWIHPDGRVCDASYAVVEASLPGFKSARQGVAGGSVWNNWKPEFKAPKQMHFVLKPIGGAGE